MRDVPGSIPGTALAALHACSMLCHINSRSKPGKASVPACCLVRPPEAHSLWIAIQQDRAPIGWRWGRLARTLTSWYLLRCHLPAELSAQSARPRTLRSKLNPWWVPEEMSLARLAQSAERKALNLVVVGSSPTVGAWIAHAQAWLCCTGVLTVAHSLLFVGGACCK